MSISFIGGNVLAFADDRTTSAGTTSTDNVSFQNVTGSLNLSSVVLNNLSNQVMTNTTASSSVKDTVTTVIVSLSEKSLVEKSGEDETVAEYMTTYDGGKTIKKITSAQNTFLSNLSSLGVNYTVVDRYNTVLSGVAIKVNTKYLSTIKSISGVTGAYVSEKYAYPETTTGTSSTSAVTNESNMYATGIYNSSAQVAAGYDGSGMTVAILDTGLDYTHEAFSHLPTTYSFDEDYIQSVIDNNTLNAVTLSGGKLSASDLYVSAKVPFAYDYADKDTDVYPSYSQHGTHVAGIVAGEASSYKDKDGNLVEEEFLGVAPQAQLVICKVFTDDFESSDLGGAVTEDIVAALEDCVKLNVDVINMSLGTTAGFSTKYIEGDDEGTLLANVYTSIKNKGISLICAASNDFSSGYGSAFGTNLASNPESGTIGSPSTYTGAVSVASINGQLSPFMLANGTTSVFYEESNNQYSQENNFAEEMLGTSSSGTFKYVIIPNTGRAADYSTRIQNLLKNKEEGEKVIAVIKRGTNTFKDKVQIAARYGADAVIVYNNVAGTIKMSLGDLENPIPAVSISMDAGKALISGATSSVGYIEVNKEYNAGPFMNGYSSWGSTPDLKLKPDVTAHGGEITSTVSGGYSEMSGTSMASPNLAGFVALVRSYLKQKFPDYNNVQLTKLINQIVMSTASTVYDEEGLAYSPRKQGSGLATLANAFGTSAYLYTLETDTYGAEDDRPKAELGEDENKTGVYTIKFYVSNFGESALSFKTKSLFMTETISSDGLSVAEKAHMLTDIAAIWKINGTQVAEGESFTVAAGTVSTIEVTLQLSDAEKKYIDTNFVNGMYVEGFLKLESLTEDQCTLNLPFMGFYGDWDAAPLLDYDAYEIADFKQDSSYTDETRPQESVWATQAYATYYNEKYTVPIGSFVYVQNEDDDSVEKIYANEEHNSISCYNDYYGEDDLTNYMTTTSIKALYAGLLRNAELVTYELYDVYTGELIKADSIYNLHKAYANGGSSVPSQVLLELDPMELGLIDNGKYRLDFKFFRTTDDKDTYDATGVMNEENTFSMSFYADYQAPVLQDARVRYYTYKENNKEKQRVYLDLDVYDNHYAQSVLLCYSNYNKEGTLELDLATEYVTPVYNAVRNGTTTVSIEITDFYEKYKDSLYVQIDDYALNHNVYQLSFTNANTQNQASSFEVSGSKEITLGVNETYKVSLTYYDSNNQVITSGNVSASNYNWRAANPTVVSVKNGEIFAKKAGKSNVTVSDANGHSQTISVVVTESTTKLATPSISFGAIETANEGLKKASGSVKVYAGEIFTLSIETDPWYYPVENLKLKWSSTDESVATVTQDGIVTTLDKRGTTSIKAVILNDNGLETSYSTSVILSVQDPFTVSSYTLTSYHGSGGVVTIPADMNIMYIGEEAFKDNDNITTIIIPKTVTQIQARAFKNCTALENVYFIDTEKQEPANSELALILNSAFEGCTNLKKFDLSNCKTITIDKLAFKNCTSLEQVVDMDKIGTMNYGVFLGCSSLKSADITGLHVSGTNVFEGCTSLTSVKTAYYTDMGEYMFMGCTALESIDINCASVAAGSFYGCTSLKSVTFGGDKSSSLYATAYTIGASAFEGCRNLSSVSFNGNILTSVGDRAFANCTSLTSFPLTNTDTAFGNNVFVGTNVTLDLTGTNYELVDGALYLGTVLVRGPKVVPADFTLRAGTTEIAAYAFTNSTFEGKFVVPSTIKAIGEGAFYGSTLSEIDLGDITSIEDGLLAGTQITTITISNKITSIGSEAFADCANLESVVFESGSALKYIGDSAFTGCTALTQITLPDGVETMGSRVFAYCTSLESVVLPSLKSLGGYTFFNTPALVEVTFGENASTTGTYTFYGISYTMVGGSPVQAMTSKLTKVTLGNATTEIGAGVFAYCNKLESLDIKNVTTISTGAFAFCTSLKAGADWLKNVTYIGDAAFRNTALTSVNLAAATYIGDSAFANTGTATLSTLNIPVVEYLGNNAFYGSALSSVTIPACTTYVGSNVFGNSASLTSIDVNASNKSYFAESGVVYRYITDTTYELVIYPTLRYATNDNGTRTYSIKEGTVSVLAYAFANIKAGTVAKVVLPYSVKTLGHAAFYSSGISVYHFESISAPELLTEQDSFAQESMGGRYTFYYNTFGDYFVYYYSLLDGLYTPDLETPETLTIYYPTNGEGYDNFIYSNYFATKVTLGELMDDDTRGLKQTIEGFVSVDTVSSWNSLAVTEENKAMVESFSAEVKDAHRIYNNIKSSVQLEYLGDDNAQKLFDIESALKSVKSRFGISVSASSLTIASTSTHKTAYVEGEQFDMTGLVLTVTYDDYSTEVADLSQIKLSTTYPNGLSTLNRYVTLEGYGVSVQVAITVTEQADDNNGSTGGNNGGSTEGGSTEGGSDSTTETTKKKKGCKGELSTMGIASISAVSAVIIVAYISMRKRLYSNNKKDSE
jgi:lactocepin